MGYRSVRKAFGDYNAYVFYLDDGAVDLPIIKDRTSIMPGSEAHDLNTLDMWILNSDFEWEYCPWKNGKIGGASAEVTKSYVDSQDLTYYNKAINYFLSNNGIKYVSELPTTGDSKLIYGITTADGLTLYVYRNGTWLTIYSQKFGIDNWVSKHSGTGMDADYPYTKPEVLNLIASMKNILVVTDEPTTPIKNTIYYIGPDPITSTYNVVLYDSMLNRIPLGTSSVDFTNYQEKVDTDLITTSKMVVPAINELCEKVLNKQDSQPTIGSLATEATTIVAAINEVFNNPVSKTYAELGNKTLIQAIQDCSSGSFAAAYPVGSIYLSMGVDPNTLGSGMTWVRLSGKFLLGASSNTDHGQQGGASTATLAVENLPAHNHTVTVKDTTVGYTMPSGSKMVDVATSSMQFNIAPLTDNEPKVHNHGADCANTGEGKAFDILPPYLKVDIWQRTA